MLSSVFGPYAQDDEYGGRRINPMELYHNQVTRVQGPFSLRVFHRSWGLMMIQANMAAPCTLLDFPDLDRFVEEIRTHRYDIVGISSILVNVLKVEKMCQLVRQHLPEATIVVGGHIANLPDLAERIDADYIVKGEGIRWFRRFLGEDDGQPIRHPILTTPIDMRNVGVDVSSSPSETALTLIPSVGCPMGCNFCSTSAMFGGKGKFNNFYSSGDDLFDILCQFEQQTGARSFFVMDENFLLHRRRALRLLELMQQHDKAWTFYAFSSANVLRSYTIEQLVSLGNQLGVDGARRREAASTPSSRHRHPIARSPVAVARHPRAWFDHHRAGGAHAGEHRRGHRSCSQPRHRLSSVHALHAAAMVRRCMLKCRIGV